MDAFEPEEKHTGPRSVLRVMQILAVLADGVEGQTLAALSEDLGLPKTSLFSLLKALEAGGYVRHAGGHYILGAQALKLGASLSQASSFPRCARPTLEWLAAVTQETIILGVLAEGRHEVTYVDVIESEKLLRFAVKIGNRRPLYCTAAGNVMLAYMGEDERHAYMNATQFVKFTPMTCDRAQLEERVAGVHATGIAFDIDGLIDGASAIAGIVFDASGQAFCSISVAGPTVRLRENVGRLTELVRNASEELSRILNYRGPYPATPDAAINGLAAPVAKPPRAPAKKKGRPAKRSVATE